MATLFKRVRRAIATRRSLFETTGYPTEHEPMAGPSPVVDLEADPVAEAEVLAERAAALAEQGKPRDAALVARRVLDLATPDAANCQALGDILLAGGEEEAAAAMFRTGLAADASVPALHIGLCRALRATGRIADALTVARDAAARFPEEAAPREACGDLELAQGLIADAEASFSAGLRINRRDVACHRGLIEALHRTGRLDEAATAAREAVALLPGRNGLRSAAVRVLLAQGDLDGAEAMFRDGLARDETVIGFHLGLAETLGRARRFEDGIAAAERGLSLFPDSLPLLAQLARLQLWAGRLEAAELGFRAGIGVDPEFPAFAHGLADTLRRQGRLAEAEALVREAEARFPGNEAFGTLRARVEADRLAA
ncbi:MAG TPA: tetratricopeptide repeat protein [Acetobacteraceae bacterium]|nr:tetratricopeptide repeat protein [Acetobacteraceae bacterium]